MTLAIITNDGEVVTVIENLEGYDLSKPIARTHVTDEIESALTKITAQSINEEPSVLLNNR